MQCGRILLLVVGLDGNAAGPLKVFQAILRIAAHHLNTSHGQQRVNRLRIALQNEVVPLPCLVEGQVRFVQPAQIHFDI